MAKLSVLIAHSWECCLLFYMFPPGPKGPVRETSNCIHNFVCAAMLDLLFTGSIPTLIWNTKQRKWCSRPKNYLSNLTYMFKKQLGRMQQLSRDLSEPLDGLFKRNNTQTGNVNRFSVANNETWFSISETGYHGLFCGFVAPGSRPIRAVNEVILGVTWVKFQV